MSDEDISFVKKKKKIVLDDGDGADEVNVITTKAGTENAARDHYDHSKINGDKSSNGHKNSPKKHDADKKRPENSNANIQNSSSSRPPEQKDKKDQKVESKPKPSGSTAERKPSEPNGQQKKQPEEKKVNAEKQSPTKPHAKPAPKKKRDESESESEESASESESEDEREKRKKKKSTPPKKPVKKEESKEKPKKRPGEVQTVTKNKNDLVYEVLKRWWYALPEWPPAGFDYDAELSKRKLRKVDQRYWRSEPEEKNGLKKVVEMPSFVGVYKDSKGELIDLRPKESCPSYRNFKSKSVIELIELHTKALKGQVEELEKDPNCDERLLGQLKGELKRAERTFEAHKAKTSASTR